ncbi:MAG: hypothetical protein ONB48_03210 [candidate division KSB1 bacterium]|nr:hypothetical protein [candidate division KSB1 bacterium]MDZ7275653.1 hypothetical protein [candidate division KSB1 bacterium]MDZ7284656.1 hypothetical protein [candidate division KSB1 bacterium]MDZ7297925.1 hypothetical protein [candidate division KSB1 bacterium]MDZ7307110.1 hypothetical protein [candidate division KSB1 bacterium]
MRFHHPQLILPLARFLFILPEVLCAQPHTSASQLTVGVYPVVAVADNAMVPGDSLFAERARELGQLLAAALHQHEELIVLFPDLIMAQVPQPAAFNPLEAGAVRQLCSELGLHRLLVPTVEISNGAREHKQRWRMLLRWLAADTGEMTKSHLVEFEIIPSQHYDASQPPAGFRAAQIIAALLRKPEVSPTPAAATALPVMPAPPELSSPPTNKRRWLWYVAGAAVVGGSAYWIFGREAGSGSQPQLLPEPPGPPRQ